MSSRSDHVPLLLRFGSRREWRPVNNSFRYEHMWERADNLSEVVANAWSGGGPGHSLEKITKKLQSMQGVLSKWAQKEFCSVQNRIKSLKDALKGFRMLHQTPEIEEKMRRTESELDEWLYREEMMWRQRSRITWLREGDRNTEFFHRKATWRRKKNKITKLKREDGSWAEKTEDIHVEMNNFFQGLYTRDDKVIPQELIDLFPKKVDDKMNETLVKTATDEEIGDALFQIGPLKALGPDGFPARFFPAELGNHEGGCNKWSKKVF